MHFFQDQMMTFMGQPAKDIEPYTPHEFLGRPDGDRTIVFWETEDREARVLAFDKARPRVETAWKELEARKLAQKEADRLAVQAKADQGDRQKLLDLAAQSNREYFEVGPLARFMPNPTPNPMAGQFRQYQMLDRELFRYPPDKITYPTLELQKKMLDLRKDPKGATAVVSDQPKNHFYVIEPAAAGRADARKSSANSYVHSMATATEFDPLLAILANRPARGVPQRGDRAAAGRGEARDQPGCQGKPSPREDTTEQENRDAATRRSLGAMPTALRGHASDSHAHAKPWAWHPLPKPGSPRHNNIVINTRFRNSETARWASRQIDLKALLVEHEDCDAGTVQKLRNGLAQGGTAVPHAARRDRDAARRGSSRHGRQPEEAAPEARHRLLLPRLHGAGRRAPPAGRHAPWPTFYLGRALAARGEYDEALKAFEKAEKLGYTASTGPAAEGRHLPAARATSTQARDILSQLKKEGLESHNAEYHFQLAGLHQAEGDRPGAVKHLERAVELDPGHTGALFQLGHANDLAGNDDEAIALLRAVPEAPAGPRRRAEQPRRPVRGQRQVRQGGRVLPPGAAGRPDRRAGPAVLQGRRGLADDVLQPGGRAATAAGSARCWRSRSPTSSCRCAAATA